MINLKKFRAVYLRYAVVATFAALCTPSHAGPQVTAITTIDTVSVSGGGDTVNPGVTCIKLTIAVAPACGGGWIAIPNNNKQLIAAALMLKATAGNVAVYYDDAAGSNHCPALWFTPCAAVSILGR